MLLAGGVIILVAALSPYPGEAQGKSLLSAAEKPDWRHFGDWPAFFASAHILLLNVGLLLILFALAVHWYGDARKWMTNLLVILMIIPSAGALYGFYLIVKALF